MVAARMPAKMMPAIRAARGPCRLIRVAIWTMMVSASASSSHGAGAGHAVAHQTDDDGHAHGNHHPGGSHPPGELQLFLILDGHKAQQDMGHSEVAQPPGQQGADGQQAVGVGAAGGGVVDVGKGQVAGQGAGIVQHGVDAAGLADAEGQHHHQGDGHDDGLHQVGEGGGQEAAQHGVNHDYRGGDQHGRHIVRPEQAGEELAAGREAGGQIGDKEDDDDHGGDGREQVPPVAPALGEKLGHGDGAQPRGIAADASGDDEPVEVRAHRQTDGRPAGLGQAGEVGHAGQAHQQPGGHIAGLGAHGRDEGAQLASAQVEVIHRGVLPGVHKADPQHSQQIEADGQ